MSRTQRKTRKGKRVRDGKTCRNRCFSPSCPYCEAGRVRWRALEEIRAVEESRSLDPQNDD